ncbi:MAG: IS1595 family transposase [Proteobacteria bacterium]|nr:IS1595 family transposase [Pseudomonadota bacterium]MBU1058821.1 IS1595 family transposase [Pseudomonadota bacterium]
MAKNKIQFQAGLSLKDFLAQFGTEDQCRQVLFELRWPQGFVCPECGHTGYCELKSRKLFQCNSCRSQISVTAGTIFASTKLPLATWFMGIYFITQSKVSVSALSLSKTLSILYNTALLMKHKIQQVMKERDDSKPLTHFVQIDDAYWGGKKRDGKRGRGAIGKIPFVAAISSNKQGHPDQMRFTQVKSFSKKAIESWAKEHLAPGSQVISDGLGCFSAIEDAGSAHTTIITGGGPNSVKISEFKWVNTIIGNVKKCLHGIFHAISKKHFSRYLAEFCYRFNRRYDLSQMISRLCYVALRTPPMSKQLLRVAEFHT